MKYYSASKLNTYLMCPYRYYLKYIKKEAAPLTPYLSFGITVHKILEDFHKYVASHRNLSPEMFEHKLKEIAAQRIQEVKPEWLYTVGITKPFLYEQYLKGYFDYFIKKRIFTYPLEVEKQINIPLTQDIRLQGKIDLKVAETIIDFKTSKSVPAAKQLLDELQTKIYALSTPTESTFVYLYLKEPFSEKALHIAKPSSVIRKEIIQLIHNIENTKVFHKDTKMCYFCPYKDTVCKGGK